MLQHPGACDVAALGDVAREHHGHVVGLGPAHQRSGALPYLADAARGGGERVVVDRLYRVDDAQRRPAPVQLRGHGVQRGGVQQHQPVAGYPKALGPQLDLRGRFLAADVENSTCPGRVGRDAQHERGLADSRIAGYQAERTGDDPAAEDAVDFGRGRQQARQLVRRQGRELTRGSRFQGGAASSGRTGGVEPVLDQGVPLAAGRAAALPLRALVAAGLAQKRRLGPRPGHGGAFRRGGLDVRDKWDRRGKAPRAAVLVSGLGGADR